MAATPGTHFARSRHRALRRGTGEGGARRLTGAVRALGVLALCAGLLVAFTALARAQDPVADPGVAPATPALGRLPAAAPPPAARRPSPVTSAAAASVPLPAPQRLGDLGEWIEYKLHNHIATLPHEARLFYRRGLALHQSGSREEAVRLVRGATELDPSFVAPHLTLASWFLLREPSQALLQCAAVLELSRQNFLLQLALAANALYVGLQALFLALLAAALIVVGLHHRELRHGWQERLALYASPETARWWSWAILVLPFVAGLGLALPAGVFLGLLWPSLRVRERLLWVMLVAFIGALPWTLSSLDRLAAPLREDQGPLYGVPMVENEVYSPERQAHFAALAAQHPDNGFVAFGHAWLARRGGDLAAAETSYRRALALWPTNDRVWDDLGNTLAMQGRADDALECYLKATRLNPANAAASFNAAQIYTQRFQYHEASDAMARASALNFDMVKGYQSQATEDGLLPLADEWLAPATFWQAVGAWREGDGRLNVPPSWRGHIETAGWGFSVLAVALALCGLGWGLWQHRALPLRTCSNCGNVVCRRCAERRRELALCPSCAAVESRAESPEFARVLLHQHRRALQSQRHLARTALATLVPGYGLLACRRVGTPLVLLAFTALLSAGWLGLSAPFSYEPRLALPEADVPLAVVIGSWVAVYAVSILSYLAQVARVQAQEAALAAPVRSRSVQSTRRVAAAA